MVTLTEDFYQVRKGLQNIVVLKLAQWEILKAYLELNAKVRFRKRLKVNKERGKKISTETEIGSLSVIW